MTLLWHLTGGKGIIEGLDRDIIVPEGFYKDYIGVL